MVTGHDALVAKQGAFMDLQLWAEMSSGISDVAQRLERQQRDTHSTARIVRVHLWSVLHDRPTCWACVAKNWTDQTRPAELPDQSTMSRRMKRADFEEFLTLLSRRMNGHARDCLLKVVDGKPLELSNNSADPNAAWGHGVSRTARGYKLHAVFSGNPMPDAFAVTPLNTCEKQMAARLIKRVQGGGYLLADSNYNASWLFDHCNRHNHQLACPRQRPGTALGHHPHSPHRLRAMDMLEPPANVNPFGPQLYRRRTDIERQFSGVVCFGGGLTTLPPWVRRIWRVRRWVWGKLLVNAARIRLNRCVGA
jgi:hypothetical protein